MSSRRKKYQRAPQPPMPKKYCRFKKHGIKHVDFKDKDFLMKFVNEQGKILPRRLTGVTAKQQRQLARAVKQARILGFLQFLYKE